jgi:hypothetical protein
MTILKIDGEGVPVNLKNFALCPTCSGTRRTNCPTCEGKKFIPNDGALYYKHVKNGYKLLTEYEHVEYLSTKPMTLREQEMNWHIEDWMYPSMVHDEIIQKARARVRLQFKEKA